MDLTKNAKKFKMACKRLFIEKEKYFMKKLFICLFLIAVICGFSCVKAQDLYTVEDVLKNVKSISNMSPVANNENQNTITKSIEKYKQRNMNYFNAPKSMEKPRLIQMHASQNDGVSADNDVPISDLGRVELPWYNGNYLVWNTDTGYNSLYFAAEYDKNKDFIGLVAILDDDGVIQASEYLFEDDWYVPLKSVFIYYKKDKAAFLYDENKNLLMCNINGLQKIWNSNIVKNTNFMNQILPKFDNPKRYVVPYKD